MQQEKSQISIMPIIALIIASPILILILSIIGLATMTSFITKLFDIVIISISIIVSAIIFGLQKSSIRTAITVSAMVGFVYWAFGIYMTISGNQVLGFICGIPILGGIMCGVGMLFDIPSLIANIFAVLFWVSLSGVFFRKL